MKTTTYIAIIAALTVATAPLTATARSHRHRTGAALTGLAVGLGIGLLSTASAQATQPIYRYETTPVVISQPVPVYYSPPPVYYAPTPVYAPVYRTQNVIIQPPAAHRVIHSYPTHYRSTHRGSRGVSYYGPPASSHRGTQAAPRRYAPRSSHRGYHRR